MEEGKGRVVRLAAVAAALMVAFVISALAPGCSTAKSKREDLITQLCEAAEAFNKFFKWGDFDGAAAFVDPKSMETYARWVAEYEDRFMAESFRVMSCTLDDPEDTEPPFEATVVVRYKGVVILPEARRRDYVWVQKWEFHGENWLVQPEFSVFER